MTDTTTPTAGVIVLGKRAMHNIGAVGTMTVTAVICPAGGSQKDRGYVADVTVGRGPGGGIAAGYTTDDPDALERAGRTLIAAAIALREARS